MASAKYCPFLFAISLCLRTDRFWNRGELSGIFQSRATFESVRRVFPAQNVTNDGRFSGNSDVWLVRVLSGSQRNLHDQHMKSTYFRFRCEGILRMLAVVWIHNVYLNGLFRTLKMPWWFLAAKKIADFWPTSMPVYYGACLARKPT